MENKLIIVKDGKKLVYDFPKYGQVVIQIVDGKPMSIDRTEKTKI